MKNHTKKIIAPVIITVILVLYLTGYAIAGIFMGAFTFFPGIIFAVIAIAGIILSIYTLIERIKEIRNGEEDDLSKY